MRFTATIYGETIQANTTADLKRKASIIANRRYNAVDEMAVSFDGMSVTLRRFNILTPWNTITRDKWH